VAGGSTREATGVPTGRGVGLYAASGLGSGLGAGSAVAVATPAEGEAELTTAAGGDSAHAPASKIPIAANSVFIGSVSHYVA